jgi:hypothetical protein
MEEKKEVVLVLAALVEEGPAILARLTPSPSRFGPVPP